MTQFQCAVNESQNRLEIMNIFGLVSQHRQRLIL